MTRLNYSRYGSYANVPLEQDIRRHMAFNRDCNKHRMTYERAGLIFQAYKDNVSAFSNKGLALLVMGLRRPNIGDTFAQFIDLNADRLQLFDDDPVFMMKIGDTYITSYEKDFQFNQHHQELFQNMTRSI